MWRCFRLHVIFLIFFTHMSLARHRLTYVTELKTFTLFYSSHFPSSSSTFTISLRHSTSLLQLFPFFPISFLHFFASPCPSYVRPATALTPSRTGERKARKEKRERARGDKNSKGERNPGWPRLFICHTQTTRAEEENTGLLTALHSLCSAH